MLNDVTFEQFTQTVEQMGYTAGETKTFFWTYVSFVKAEIKKRSGKRCLSFGYGLTDEDAEILKSELESLPFVDKVKMTNYGMDAFGDFDLDCFIECVKHIQYLVDNDVFTGAYNVRKGYVGYNTDGLFANIATVMKAASDTKMYGMINRSVFDSVDNIIALNKPLAEDSYREHIVPCVMIIQEAFRMFDKDNATVADVAAMIQQNLFVFHITKQEANHLDIELGLRTTMPEGWNFGDNVFARLDAANISHK